ncbi:MAG: alpha/beta fold hydrolase [Steroidobacteraceae bacterium]
MHVKRGPLLIALATLGLGAVVASDSSRSRIDLGPCDEFKIDGARCGFLSVPENWATSSGRRIGIHVAVAPATGSDAAVDPIFFFYGGPGAAASSEAPESADFWRELRVRRDLVFIDQRGTGRSAPLHCRYAGDPHDPNTYAIDLFDIAHLKSCHEHHAEIHDLTQYGTADAIQDAEAVRVALGYARINAVGESYGTRVVQEYARRHPERIRTALLLGVVPPSASITEGMAASLDATLGQFFTSCESDRGCAAAFPDLRSRTASLLMAANDAGFSAEIRLGQGELRMATISYELGLAWIRSRLYSVTEAARLPRILSQASRGDARELVRGAIHWRREISSSLSEGMYASVTCAEDMPFVDVEAEIAAATGTWLGSHRVTIQQAACAIWPRPAVADDIKHPLDVKTPILVMNGDRDPATSLDWARTAVSHAPNARLVVAQNRSHALTHDRDPCLRSLASQFVDTADPASIDDACAAKLALPPFDIAAGTD